MRRPSRYLTISLLLLLTLVLPLLAGCDREVENNIWIDWEPLGEANQSAEYSVKAGRAKDLQFRWYYTESPIGAQNHTTRAIFDPSVSIRVRDAKTNRLVTGFTYGYGITYYPNDSRYKQTFDTAKYGISAGTDLKIMVYFGGKLKDTALLHVTR